MNPLYKIIVSGDQFFIQSTNEDLTLSITQQSKGENIIEIEGKKFHVEVQGKSARIEKIQERIQALSSQLSSQSDVSLKSIYACILEMEEDQLDSNDIYKNFGTIQRISSKHFDWGNIHIDWESGQSTPRVEKITGVAAKESAKKLRELEEKIDKLGENINGDNFSILQSTNFFDQISPNYLIAKIQKESLEEKLKEHRIMYLKEALKYDQSIPLDSIGELAIRNDRLNAIVLLAIKTEQVVILRNLLQMGDFDINKPDKQGLTLLHFACSLSDSDQVIKTLIEQGANANIQEDTLGFTPLQFGVFRNTLKPDTIQLLLEKSDVNLRDKEGKTVLYYAISPSMVELIPTFLKYLDPNEKDNQGRTPLHEACSKIFKGSKSVISHLLTAGAIPTIQDNEETTPLHCAALRACTGGDAKENKQIVQLLLQAGGSVKQINKKGQTPLHMAVYRGGNSYAVISELIKQGADVNAQDENGETPLHYAARSCNITGVQELLKQGAIKNIRNKDGFLPGGVIGDLVYSEKGKEIMNLLIG